MRKALKFLHTLGGVGLLGTFMTLVIVLALLPDPLQDIHGYAALTELVDRLARWVLLPSLAITLVSGLLSIGAVTAFHSAGWAWLKLATGVVMFEGTLLAVQGPIQREANLTRQFLNGDLEASREWLKMAAFAEPDSVWNCSNCGQVAADWDPLCKQCGTFDSLEWRTPPRVTRM